MAKRKLKKLRKKPKPAVPLAAASPAPLPEAPKESTLLQSLQEVLKQPETNPTPRILPAEEQNPNPASTASSPIRSNFEKVAASVEAEVAVAAGSESETIRTPDSDVEILPPEEAGPKRYVTAQTALRYRKLIMCSIVKRYGQAWELEEEEMKLFAELDADMINEQLPRFLADSRNKALMLWLGMNAAFIGASSGAAGKFLEWVIEKINGLFSAAGSPES